MLSDNERPFERTDVAFHEAGHVVVARHYAGELGQRLVRVSIERDLADQEVWGRTDLTTPSEAVASVDLGTAANMGRKQRRRLQARVVLASAGGLAMQMFRHHRAQYRAHDLNKIYLSLSRVDPRMVRGNNVATWSLRPRGVRYFQRLERIALRLLEEYRRDVVLVAVELLSRGALTADEVNEVITRPRAPVTLDDLLRK